MPTTLQGIDALSERQKEVLRLTAQHLQAKEIAYKLNITERTVRAHTESARRRLGAATSREAVRLFIAEEVASAIVKNDQWSSSPIAEIMVTVAASPHEQALSPTITTQRNHDHHLSSSGNGMADVGRSRQDPAYRGRDRDPEDAQPDTRSGESNLQHGHYRGVSDGRWDEFRRKLKDLPAIQLLGLIVIAAFALALIAGMLAGTLLGMVEAVHKLTIYAGWKS